MKTITIINNKGGVGKTTSAQNIASALSLLADKKVLMIDLDSQANLTKGFGIGKKDVQEDVGSFIMGDAEFNEVVKEITPNLFILPSSAKLIAKEDLIKNDATFPLNLKTVIEDIKQKENFDFVVVDCPPALSGLTRIAIVGCDYYFVPLQAEYFSYEGLRSLLDFTKKMKAFSPNMQLGGVFATRYNPNTRKKIAHDLVKATKESIGDVFMDSYIRENVAISECQASGTDVFRYNQDSNGASDYYNLTKEIITRIK